MRLSEAILLGSTECEQGIGPKMIIPQGTRKCALGAALSAIGCQETDQVKCYTVVRNTWPWTDQYVKEPCNIHGYRSGGFYKVYDVIWRLNDCARWTRPEIAAWVASIEPSEEEVLIQEEAPAQLDTRQPV
jgi:hypothetical protein